MINVSLKLSRKEYGFVSDKYVAVIPERSFVG